MGRMACNVTGALLTKFSSKGFRGINNNIKLGFRGFLLWLSSAPFACFVFPPFVNECMCFCVYIAEALEGEPQPPAITRPLASQHVRDGTPAILECSISGNPKPLITWFHECSVVEQSDDFMQFYDEERLCSLVIKETYPEDTGRYTVVAKNSHGTVTCSADLVVIGRWRSYKAKISLRFKGKAGAKTL